MSGYGDDQRSVSVPPPYFQHTAYSFCFLYRVEATEAVTLAPEAMEEVTLAREDMVGNPVVIPGLEVTPGQADTVEDLVVTRALEDMGEVTRALEAMEVIQGVTLALEVVSWLSIPTASQR